MTISKEEIATGYDNIVDKIGQDQEFYTRCLSLCNDYKGKILDAGCGRGFLLQRIAEVTNTDNKLYGIDISGKLCEIAKANNPGAEIIQGDVEALPYADNFFDTVFMTETLEHLLDYDKAILEASRVLKKGGTLVVTVPNRDWFRYDFYEGLRKKFQPVDDHFFKFNEITGILNRNNFKIHKYKGSDNLFYYQPIHKFEQMLAFFIPYLHRRMKRIMFGCINTKK